MEDFGIAQFTIGLVLVGSVVGIPCIFGMKAKHWKGLMGIVGGLWGIVCGLFIAFLALSFFYALLCALGKMVISFFGIFT